MTARSAPRQVFRDLGFGNVVANETPEQDQRISLDVGRIHDHEPLEGPHIVTAT